MTCNLTDDLIREAIGQRRGRSELIDEVEGGLRLRLGSNVAHWSMFVSSPKIAKVRMALGRWPVMSVTAARAAASILRANFAAAVRENREDLNVSWLLSHYRREHLGTLRTGERIFAALRRGLSELSPRFLWALRPEDISRAIIVVAARAPQQANCTLAFSRSMFSWAVARGYMRANPANGLGPPAPRVRRSRVLSPAELIALWDAAEEMSPRLLGYPFTQLLRLLILTGKRRDAVANMRFDELDLPPGIDTGIWTPTTLAPGLGGTERVSLPPLARRLVQQGLDNRPYCDSPCVFLTRENRPVSGWSWVKLSLEQKWLERFNFPPWRFDDLRLTRKTFVDGLSDGADAAARWEAQIDLWITQHSEVGGGNGRPARRPTKA